MNQADANADAGVDPGLAPDPAGGRLLHLWNPVDYLRLSYWILFHPPGLRHYIDQAQAQAQAQARLDLDLDLDLDLAELGAPPDAATDGGHDMATDKLVGLLRDGHRRMIRTELFTHALLAGTLFPGLWALALHGRIDTPLNPWGVLLLGLGGGLAGWMIGAGQRQQSASTAAIFAGAFTLGFSYVAAQISPLVGLLSLFGLGPLLFLFIINAHIQLPRVATLVFPDPRQPRGQLLLWLPLLLLALYSIGTPLFGVPLEPTAALYLTGAALLLLVVVLHPGEWLRGLGAALLAGPEGSPYLPPTTRLPLPFVRQRLLRRMRDDWPAAVTDVKRVALHSGQTTALLNALNRSFEELDEQEQLARLLDLANGLEGLALFHLCGLPGAPGSDPRAASTPTDSVRLRGAPGEIVQALWRMQQRQWSAAAEMLAPIAARPGIADLAAGCEALAHYEQAQDWPGLAVLPLLPAGLLDDYPQLAEYRQLNGIVEAIGVVRDSASRSARSAALNRALGGLRRLREQAIPEWRRPFIQAIAERWERPLLEVATEVGHATIDKPVENPYIVGNPVTGSHFSGRDELVRRLRRYWVLTEQPESLVIYGHRRMGKTSVIRHLADHPGGDLRVAYLDLLTLGGEIKGVATVLSAIADAIGRALSIPAPDRSEFETLPERRFTRFLQQVDRGLGDRRLVIALDEFERIEQLIHAGRIAPSFLAYLRAQLQQSSRIALAFIGLHTLKEMSGDYFNPLFATVTPVKVGLLERASTDRIIAAPSDDFPLDYSPDALARIFAATGGQPYLAQLVGFQLVRRYNLRVFEQGAELAPLLRAAEVDWVLESDAFFDQAQYYFHGVWVQAITGTPAAPVILAALATHPAGMSLNALAVITGIGEQELKATLKRLEDKDLLHQTDGRWDFQVAMFKDWLRRHPDARPLIAAPEPPPAPPGTKRPAAAVEPGAVLASTPALARPPSDADASASASAATALYRSQMARITGDAPADRLARALLATAGWCARDRLIPTPLLHRIAAGGGLGDRTGGAVTANAVDQALHRLVDLGLLVHHPDGVSIEPRLFAPIRDASGAHPGLLAALADSLAPLTAEAVESHMPAEFAPWVPHLRTVAQRCRERGLERSAAALLLTLGLHHLGLAHFDEAATALSDALDLNTAALGPDHPDTAAAHAALGRLHLARADYSQALACFETALAINRRGLGAAHPATARLIALRAGVLGLARPRRALPLFREAIDLLDAELGAAHPESIGVRLDRCRLYLDAGLYLEAREAIAETHGLTERQGRSSLPEYPARLLLRLEVGLLIASQKYRSAERLIKPLIERDQRDLGPDHPLLLEDALMHCRVLAGLSRWDAAERAARDALTLAEATYGESHPRVATVFAVLGWLHLLKRDWVASMHYLMDAMALYDKSKPYSALGILSSLFSLGLVAYQMGDRQTAQTYYEQCSDIVATALDGDSLFWQTLIEHSRAINTPDLTLSDSIRVMQQNLKAETTLFGPGSPRLWADHFNLALYLFWRGDAMARVFSHVQTAIDLRTREVGSEDPETARCLSALSRYLWYAGQTDPRFKEQAKAQGKMPPHTLLFTWLTRLSGGRLRFLLN